MLSIHFYAGRPPLPEKPEDPAVWRMREYRRAIGDLVKFEERIVESAQWARKLSTQEHTCRVAVDEWGTWYREATPENRLVQRITLGDALFAAGCLHVMQRHEAVAMANLAQTINVLSALIQTRGQEFVKTVMYDVWEMFRPHQGARFVPVEVEAPPATRVETADGQKDIPGVSVSVSREEKSGEVCVSLVNFDAQREARLTLEGLKGMRQREARILTAGDLFEGNTFAKPDGVRVREWDVQTLRGAIGLPARSVATICFQI
jgi:alpha-N-arabinofuranosidase